MAEGCECLEATAPAWFLRGRNPMQYRTKQPQSVMETGQWRETENGWVPWDRKIRVNNAAIFIAALSATFSMDVMILQQIQDER